MVEEKVTGTKSWKEREIGKILQQGQRGDVIVVAEVSRLARSTLGVLELLQVAAEKEISVHIAVRLRALQRNAFRSLKVDWLWMVRCKLQLPLQSWD